MRTHQPLKHLRLTSQYHHVSTQHTHRVYSGHNSFDVVHNVLGDYTFQSDRGETGHLLFAIGSLCVALGMAVYAVRFIKKTRELGIH